MPELTPIKAIEIAVETEQREHEKLYSNRDDPVRNPTEPVKGEEFKGKLIIHYECHAYGSESEKAPFQTVDFAQVKVVHKESIAKFMRAREAPSTQDLNGSPEQEQPSGPSDQHPGSAPENQSEQSYASLRRSARHVSGMRTSLPRSQTKSQQPASPKSWAAAQDDADIELSRCSPEVLERLINDRLVSFELYAIGKQIFILLDGGRVVLRVHLGLQGQIMLVDTSKYNETVGDVEPICVEHGTKDDVAMAYRMREEYYENGRGDDILFRPIFSIVGEHRTLICADFNKLTQFWVYCSPDRNITRADLALSKFHLENPEASKTKIAPTLLGKGFGPSVFDDFTVYWDNLLHWRRLVQNRNMKTDDKAIYEFISTDNIYFNGYGQWQAGDLLALIGVDPRMPVKVFCDKANQLAWNRMQQHMVEINDPGYMQKYTKYCNARSTHLSPVKFNTRGHHNLMAMFNHTYYKDHMWLPVKQWEEDWDRGMFDRKHKRDSLYFPVGPKPRIRNEKKKSVRIVRITARDEQGKLEFTAFTPYVEEVPSTWPYSHARLELPGLAWKEARASGYKALVGSADFYYWTSSRLTSTPKYSPLIQGPNPKISRGSRGAPTKFRPSRAQLVQLEAATDMRRARQLQNLLDHAEDLTTRNDILRRWDKSTPTKQWSVKQEAQALETVADFWRRMEGAGTVPDKLKAIISWDRARPKVVKEEEKKLKRLLAAEEAGQLERPMKRLRKL